MRSSSSTQERGVPLRQPRLGSSYHQGLIIRQNHDVLITCLRLFTAVFDIHITATHIARVVNNAPNMLPRNQSNKFLATFPHMPRSPTPLPPALLCLVSPIKTGLDFSSVQKTVQEDLPSSSEHCSLLI